MNRRGFTLIELVVVIVRERHEAVVTTAVVSPVHGVGARMEEGEGSERVRRRPALVEAPAERKPAEQHRGKAHLSERSIQHASVELEPSQAEAGGVLGQVIDFVEPATIERDESCREVHGLFGTEGEVANCGHCATA